MLLLLFSFLSSLNSSLYFFNSFSMSLNHCYFYFMLTQLLHCYFYTMFTQILLQLTIVHSSIATSSQCSPNYCYSFLMLTQLLLLPLLMCTSMVKFNHRIFHRSNDFNRLIRFNRLFFTEVRDSIFKFYKKRWKFTVTPSSKKVIHELIKFESIGVV
jgi:hypothetical protein